MIASMREVSKPLAVSLFFFFLAWKELQSFRTPLALLGEQSTPPLGSSGPFAIVVRHVLILAFELFVGLTLLFNRAPSRQPERMRDVLVPLLGTFFNYTLPFANRAPAPLTANLMPVALRDAATVMALLLSVAGYAIAVWSVVSLGPSFALLVSVRTVVRHGPYRYVRHPMYLGYILLFAGILIGALSPIVIVLVAVYVSLTVYRARLEEEALTRHGDQYRDYAKRTGFLLPRLP